MRPIAAIILSTLALASCELATTITVPDEPRTAVINAVFSSDTTWRIAVSRTTPILTEISNLTQVVDVVLTLTDEAGQSIALTEERYFPEPEPGVFNPWVPPGTTIFTSNRRPQPGMTYRIEVSGSNVPTASATATAPLGVELISARLDSPAVGGYESEAYVPIEFTFQDPPGQADFYFPYLRALREYAYYDPGQGDTIKGWSEDIFQLLKTPSNDSEFIESNNEAEDIPDDTFDGKRHTVKLYARFHGYGYPSGKLVSLRLYLRHAGEEHYRYFRSVRLHENSRYNPFAEPVQVFSNVEGGLGIFAGSTVTYYEFVK